LVVSGYALQRLCLRSGGNSKRVTVPLTNVIQNHKLSKRTVAPPDASTVLCACAFSAAGKLHGLAFSFVAGGKISVADKLFTGDVLKKISRCRVTVAGGKFFLTGKPFTGDVAWSINFSEKFLAVAPRCRGQ
jgi:hypothetical protein